MKAGPPPRQAFGHPTRGHLEALAAASPLALSACDGNGRYAAWVSFDLGLVGLTVLMSALIAAALTALVSRSNDRRHLVLGWLIAFVATFALLALAIAALTDHRVFVIESVFPFP